MTVSVLPFYFFIFYMFYSFLWKHAFRILRKAMSRASMPPVIGWISFFFLSQNWRNLARPSVPGAGTDQTRPDQTGHVNLRLLAGPDDSPVCR